MRARERYAPVIERLLIEGKTKTAELIERLAREIEKDEAAKHKKTHRVDFMIEEPGYLFLKGRAEVFGCSMGELLRKMIAKGM